MKNQLKGNGTQTEELNEKILKIKNEINSNYPELSKYLSEMPVTITDVDPTNISEVDLKKYYNSLRDLLKKYKEES